MTIPDLLRRAGEALYGPTYPESRRGRRWLTPLSTALGRAPVTLARWVDGQQPIRDPAAVLRRLDAALAEREHQAIGLRREIAAALIALENGGRSSGPRTN